MSWLINDINSDGEVEFVIPWEAKLDNVIYYVSVTDVSRWVHFSVVCGRVHDTELAAILACRKQLETLRGNLQKNLTEIDAKLKVLNERLMQ